MYPCKFDITDSSRLTAIAWRRRERWLRLVRAPSSSPAGAKSEYDAFLPCQYKGACLMYDGNFLVAGPASGERPGRRAKLRCKGCSSHK